MMRGVAALARRLHLRVFQMTLGAGYRSALKAGLWRNELIEAVAPRAGERILEVSAEGFSSCAELARRYPTARFMTVSLKTAASSAFVALGNLEHLSCCEGRIQARWRCVRQSGVRACAPCIAASGEGRVTQGNAARAPLWRCAVPSRLRCPVRAQKRKRAARRQLHFRTGQRQAPSGWHVVRHDREGRLHRRAPCKDLRRDTRGGRHRARSAKLKE